VEVSTRIHCAVTPSLEVTHIVSNSFDNTRQLYTRLLSFLTNSRTPYINMADNGNPGNFANRPKEEVQNIASKGGQASHNGGFASMDADKQVCNCSSPTLHCIALTVCSARSHPRAEKLRLAVSSQDPRRLRKLVARVDSLRKALRFYDVTTLQ
jgi:general stress protein YciG